MVEHKCKYEWYPRLAGEVFGCRECRSITTPEQVITQLEAKIDKYETALKRIANHGGGHPETLVSVMGHTAKVALKGE